MDMENDIHNEYLRCLEELNYITVKVLPTFYISRNVDFTFLLYTYAVEKNEFTILKMNKRGKLYEKNSNSYSLIWYAYDSTYWMWQYPKFCVKSESDIVEIVISVVVEPEIGLTTIIA